LKAKKNIRRAENRVYKSVIDIPKKNVLELVKKEIHKEYYRS
jgi:hypothetical protein